MKSNAQVLAILQSARVADLKRAAELVKPRAPVQLPRNQKQRSLCLLALMRAERRRSSELIDALRGS